MGGRPSAWTVVKFVAAFVLSLALNAGRLLVGWVKRKVAR